MKVRIGLAGLLGLLLAAPASAQTEPGPTGAVGEEAAPAATDASADAPASAPAEAAAPDAATAAPQATAATEAAPAEAQTETPPPLAPTGQATALDDIVVTATKRSQSVRKIPMSINAVTGEKLEEIGAHELKDFIALIPGINNQDEIAGVQRKLAIRGVGPDTGSNQTVGTVLGDVPMSDPYGSYSIADPDPWDLKTVEVLKGPQGTLFGATSLAGLIRYVPNLPELHQWSGRISADWVHVTDGATAPAFGAVINAPIGDTLAVRLVGDWQHKPGLIDMDNPSYHGRDVDDVYNRTGRAMLLWKPLEKLDVNLWYVAGQREASELPYVTNPDGKPVRSDAPAASPVKNGYALTTLDARYAFDWANLVSISGYQTKNSFNDADASYLVAPLSANGARSVHTRRNVDTNGFLQELRLVSPDDGGPWTWLIGGFYSTYEADVLATLNVYPGFTALNEALQLLPRRITGTFLDQNGVLATTTGFHPIKAGERAVYGELSRTFWDDWTLTLGGRYYQTYVQGTRETSGASSSSGEATLKQEDHGLSPKLALTWRPGENLMVYGNVSRGFQFGGFNVPLTVPIPATFESSTLWNHELGIRTDWLDRTLRADLTALYLIWDKPQINQSASVPIASYVDNVGGARSVGAETTLRYITPLPGLTIENVASYIIAKTTEPYTDSSGTVIPKGTEMPSSPRLQATTTLSYTHSFGDWQTMTALIHTHQGAAWNDIEHDVRVGNYNLLNAAFTVSRNDLPFSPSVSFWVNNVMDERALTSALGGADILPSQPGLSEAITPRPVVYTTPRSFRFNITANFD